MAFGGVLLVMGALSVVMFALLGMLICGVLLLIAAIVFGVLYHRSTKNCEEPRRWQKITAIVCAAVGAVLTAMPFVVWMILVIISN
jgi:chromate transport protein ChrA